MKVLYMARPGGVSRWYQDFVAALGDEFPRSTTPSRLPTRGLLFRPAWSQKPARQESSCGN